MNWSWFLKRSGPQPEPPGETLEESRSEFRRPAEGATRLIWRDPDGEMHSVEAQIEDASPSGFGLRIDTELPAGQMLLVGQDEGALQRAVVRHCTRCDDESWRIGVKVIESERRRVFRETLPGESAVLRSSVAGRDVVLIATVLDISEFGAQISTPRALSPNATVCLTGDQIECLAVVRYCKRRGRDYVSGLHFVRSPYQRNSLTADWID